MPRLISLFLARRDQTLTGWVSLALYASACALLGGAAVGFVGAGEFWDCVLAASVGVVLLVAALMVAASE